jgi:cytochrome c553
LNRLAIEGDVNTGHTLDDNSTVAPGGAFVNADGLNCTNCHHQHGYNPNGNSYRNLQHNPDGIVGAYPNPGVWVSYEIATTPADTADVMLTAARTYDISNVWFEEPDQTQSGYAQWCKACHTVFHGDKGSADMGGGTGTEGYRHPNADANIGAVGGGHSNLGLYVGSTNRVKVMNAGGNWASTTEADLEFATPSCFSCHKGHGNLNPFGLIFMSGTGTVTEEGDDGGDGVVEDLCGQCHVQAPQVP